MFLEASREDQKISWRGEGWTGLILLNDCRNAHQAIDVVCWAAAEVVAIPVHVNYEEIEPAAAEVSRLPEAETAALRAPLPPL